MRVCALAALACLLAFGGLACRSRQSSRPAQPASPPEETAAEPAPPPRRPPHAPSRVVQPTRVTTPQTSGTTTQPTLANPLPDPNEAVAIAPAAPPALPPAPAVENWTAAATSQPATAPAELADMPPPTPGQFVLYAISAGGPGARIRQAVDSLEPAPGEMTVSEQLLINNQPTGKPRQFRLPRLGRIWPGPANSDARTVAYTHERIDLAGRPLDCIVLTIEARAAGSLRVEKQWISREVPITHVARSTLSIDGREVMRQEAVDFGNK
jgi:hypothetical protein